MQLLVYTPNLNSRKQYIFDFLFSEVLGINYQVLDDAVAFSNYPGPKISYGPEVLANEIHFKSYGLLDELGIKYQNLESINYDNYQVFFPIQSSAMPFDVFAASFYLLSRYEEYTNKGRDQHRRFSAKYSIAKTNSFLHKPVVDIWAYDILNVLLQRFPDLPFRKRRFKFIPTLDIDRPYYFKTEKFVKRVLKQFKSFLKGRFTDPFDVYQQVAQWDKYNQQQTQYFILMGNKHEFDVAPKRNHPKFRALLQKLSQHHPMGIHPSYASHLHEDEVVNEKQALEEIIQHPIERSRQHYLKFNLPETFENLLEVGIKEDYSMAYADDVGFRAGTCTPFYWYNLRADCSTGLKVFPTIVMDQTLRTYLKLKPQEAIDILNLLLSEVKKVNGTFISLWHNESLSNFGVWEGWTTVYQHLLEEANRINK
ncbi:polysaccharide deacetylase family protein [Pedobacter glucosidilyticus]|uniref:polysaccharide deacetylase family protein n=1 Tax=Pedobacter glucosidilyticus TaxID=1122941 RepID=UPI0005605E7D|nr:polysaccharide deacetylase family protein [Pedobacter glucosidilyticus]